MAATDKEQLTRPQTVAGPEPPTLTLSDAMFAIGVLGVLLVMFATGDFVIPAIGAVVLSGTGTTAFLASKSARWAKIALVSSWIALFLYLCIGAPLLVAPALSACFAIGVGLYIFSKAPLWFRLTIELAVLGAILWGSAHLWRPWFYTEQSGRCAALARRASELAEQTEDSAKRRVLRREAEWFSRRSRALYFDGLRSGLFDGPTASRRHEIVTERQLVRELMIATDIEMHERAMTDAVEARPAHR